MKIVIQTNKIKCDMGTCINHAKYSVVPDGADKSRYVNVCEDCMRKLYNAASAIYAPKNSGIKRSDNKGDKQ